MVKAATRRLMAASRERHGSARSDHTAEQKSACDARLLRDRQSDSQHRAIPWRARANTEVNT